jgi:hypothetical protein
MAIFVTVDELPQLQRETWQPKRRPVPPPPRKPKPRGPPKPPNKPTPPPPPPPPPTKPKCVDGKLRGKLPPGSKVLVLCKPRKVAPIEKLPVQIIAKPKPLPPVAKPIPPAIVVKKPRTRHIVKIEEKELREDVRDIFDRAL